MNLNCVDTVTVRSYKCDLQGLAILPERLPLGHKICHPFIAMIKLQLRKMTFERNAAP